MVNWLSKKTRPAIVSIEADQLGELASNGKVNIVLHGDAEGEHGKNLEPIAVGDDYNGTIQDMQFTTLSKELTKKELSKCSDLLEKVSAPKHPPISRNGSANTKGPLFSPLMIGQSETSLETEELESSFSTQLKLDKSWVKLSEMLQRKSETTKAKCT
mgnify:CR=1 FL=1